MALSGRAQGPGNGGPRGAGRDAGARDGAPDGAGLRDGASEGAGLRDGASEGAGLRDGASEGAGLRDAALFRHPGADRGAPPDLAGARAVLVVRPDNVGDVVLLTPALRALRAAAPHARLDLLASPAGAAVAAMVSELSGVLVASPSWQQLTAPTDAAGAEAAVRGERDLLARIAAGGYDAMLVFTSFSQSPWPAAHLGMLAGIGTRVVHSREFAGAVATQWVTPPPDTTHHVDRSLHLLAAIGVPARGRAPRLAVPDGAHAEAAALAGESRFALLVPGASCSSRRYPAARFGAAAAVLAAAGLPVLVAGTAAEAGLVDEVVRAADTAEVRALPAVGLPVFTALVARAAVALTNNSGGLHLADAVGTPVAVTYAGTERLGDVAPRAVPSALLQVPVACSPCRQLTCPFHLECLDVAPASLARAALRLAAPSSGTAQPAHTAPTPDVPASGTSASDPEEDRWPHEPTPRIA